MIVENAPPIQDSAEAQLADDIASFYARPHEFVLFAFPWGVKGTPLAQYVGPDPWQREFLETLGREVRQRKFDGKTSVRPIRLAVASGHGIGKSTLVAWLVLWIMSTRPHCQGVVTANSAVQLESKSWASVQKWAKLCLTSHWFTVSGSRIAQVDHPKSWFCTPQTCREERSESFAGQHAANSTSFVIADEASAVPDKIFEVAEGSLTDGESHIYLFGNPTRNTGKLYRACWGSERDRWIHRSIDSRTSSLTNKDLINEWIEQYGIDSDFVKVRVLGLPPSASELQFIGSELIARAQQNTPQALEDEPLIAGFDASGGGAAWNVIRFRRGNDAVSVKPIRLTGEQGTRQVMIALIADLLSETDPKKRIAMMFVDSAFGSPIVERLHTLGHRNVMEVNFGEQSADVHHLNARSNMWFKMRDWLGTGAIDPNDDKLAMDLSGPGYHINKSNKLVLESKQDMQKRGVASPDDGDALCLTWAQTVAPPKKQQEQTFGSLIAGDGAWMT